MIELRFRLQKHRQRSVGTSQWSWKMVIVTRVSIKFSNLQSSPSSFFCQNCIYHMAQCHWTIINQMMTASNERKEKETQNNCLSNHSSQLT